MEFSQHDFRGGNFFSLMKVDGNTATIVDHRNAIIDVNSHFDRVAMASQRFVDGVIDDFKNEMVETSLARVTDIHAWPFSNGFQAFQNLYVIGIVIGVLRGF